MGLWDDPSVQRLLEAPEIGAAVQAKSMDRVVALLRARLAKSTDPAERETIERVLKNRRLFLEHLVKAPAMTTVRGIGTLLYGKSDQQTDGTYIATLFFVFFFLPIFPIAQYVVRSNGGSSYTFFGKVPLSGLMRWWRRVTALAVVGGAAAIAAGAAIAHNRSDVQLVNGLPEAVTIDIAGKHVVVDAGNHTKIRLDRGSYHAVVKLENGRVLQDEALTVPGGVDFVAFNVLGVAPLYVEEIIYTASSRANVENEAAHEIFAGSSFASKDGVRYIFSEAPKSLEVSDASHDRHEWHVGIVDGGWETSFKYLMAQGREPDATKLALGVAHAAPDAPGALASGVTRIQQTEGVERALAVARAFIEESPDAIEPHRALQTILESEGREGEVREQYRKDAAAHPESPAKAYLAARLGPIDYALGVYKGLAPRWPNHRYIHRSYAFMLFQAQRWAEAIPEYEKAMAIDPGARSSVMLELTVALGALGRANDAVNRVFQVCEVEKKSYDLPLAVRFGELVRVLTPLERVSGHREVDQCLKLMLDGREDPAARAFLAARLGDAPVIESVPPTVQPAIRMIAALERDPEAAFRAFQSDPQSAGALSEEALVLFALERVRLGDKASAAQLLAHVSGDGSRAALTERVLTGGTAKDLGMLAPAVRAALLAGAYRAAPPKKEAERTAALAEIRRLDPLHGVVSRTLERWPVPDGSAPPSLSPNGAPASATSATSTKPKKVIE